LQEKLAEQVQKAQPVLLAADKLKRLVIEEALAKGVCFEATHKRFHELAVKCVMGVTVLDGTAVEAPARKEGRLATGVWESTQNKIYVPTRLARQF